MNHSTMGYLHAAAAYDPRWLGCMDIPELTTDKSTTQTLVNQIFAYYQEALWCTPRAQDYLVQRGITDCSLLKQLGVGFVDRTLGKQLPRGKSLEGALIRGQLQRLGLLLGSGGEFLRGALVLPQYDAQGRVIAAFGQQITPRLRAGTPYQLFWSVKPAELFELREGRVSREAVLCQNPLDRLILHSAGVPHAVATLGLRSFSEVHLRQLAQSGVKTVCLAFDNTPEGNQTSGLVAQVLAACGIACTRARLPWGLGVNTCVVEHGIAGVLNAIRLAQPLRQTYEGIQAMREGCVC